MPFDPTLAAIRYGTGLSPRIEPPDTLSGLINDLVEHDRMALRHPLPVYQTVEPSLAALQLGNRLLREARGTDREADALDYNRSIRRQANARHFRNTMTVFARSLDSVTGLRERLTAFWADHFTVQARSRIQTHLVTPYAEDAIRPHITGRFGDMLRSVVLHPMMLLYLEQWRSTGPNSRLGQRLGRGLNENLARELLELHLLGVDGSYDQNDVRELAELLTGLVYHARRGFYYDERMAEPGSEEVLGITFSDKASLSNILTALDVLALHPETAQHLAQKMAVHFIRADPDAAMVDRMAQAYRDTGGNLLAMTIAMLESDAAWIPEKHKVRLPAEFITASLRALGVTGAEVRSLPQGRFRTVFEQPLLVMGQPWQAPLGPDGWSERPEDWIIPQAMAGRISWAMSAPRRILRDLPVPRDLPDPRELAVAALGDHLPAQVAFAAGAAETVSEGVGVVLSSAAFQRR